MAEKSQFEKLDTKHPDYEEWKDEWTRCRDVVGDALTKETDYLPRGIIETEEDYILRCKLSQFIPDSVLAVWKILGALYKEKPKREFKGQREYVEQFLKNSNRKGKGWNSVVEEIAFNALSYGTTRVLVNVPMVAENKTLSRYEEKVGNVYPYVINYSPLSVIDWETDDNGFLLMVRVKEERFIRGEAGGEKSHVKQIKFIEYDNLESRWWIYRKTDKGQWELKGTGKNTHGLGMVPMVCLATKDIKDMIGDPFIRYSSKSDIQKHQAESDQAYDTYVHAHPILGVWTDDEMKQIGVGASKFLKLHPGGQGINKEDAKYISPPQSAFEALRQTILDKKVQIATHAKMDPMGVIQPGISAFQASGAARAWSFGTSESRVLTKFADFMEQVERAVFELVIRYQSKIISNNENAFTGEIQYPEEFDPASTAQLLEERAQISEQINSPTLLKVIDKRIASSKVGDTSAETLRKIHDEIDKNPLINTAVGKSGDFFDSPKPSDMYSDNPKEK